MNLMSLHNNFNLNQKKCFVFDFDETLVDLDSTKTFWNDVMDGLTKMALENYGKKIDFHQFYEGFRIAKKKLGKEALVEFENYVKSQEIKAILDIAALNNRGKDIFNYVKTNYVDKSNQKIWIVVLSNNFCETVRIGLEKFNYNVDFFYGRDAVNKLKPNPEGLEKIFQKIGSIKKKEMVLFGDSIYDKKAAKNFGIEFICVKDFCSD